MNRIPAWPLIALLLAPLPATVVAADGDRCARISTFDIAPRKQKLYPAVLIAVDGRLPGPTSASSWRLEPGPHTLTVAEAIETHEFSGVQLRQRDGRERRDRYKTLQITAEPGITYRLAAQFKPDARTSIRDGAYWEPVIWKQSAESCR